MLPLEPGTPVGEAPEQRREQVTCPLTAHEPVALVLDRKPLSVKDYEWPIRGAVARLGGDLKRPHIDASVALGVSGQSLLAFDPERKEVDDGDVSLTRVARPVLKVVERHPMAVDGSLGGPRIVRTPLYRAVSGD